jgi:hypothetical protein
MANIDRIVNVQISLNTTAVREKSFSDLLIFGPHLMSPSRVQVVTGVDDLPDLWKYSPDIYIAVRDAFAQIPTLNRVFIGRRQVSSTEVIVREAPAGTTYSLVIGTLSPDGYEVSYPVTVTGDPEGDPQDTAAALAGAINATAAPVTATAAFKYENNGTLQIAGDSPGAVFSLKVGDRLSLGVQTWTEAATDALRAISAENSDWYGVVCATRDSQADIMSTAEWVEANEKLFVVSSKDAGVLSSSSGTDIASVLQQRQFFRTALYFHQKADTECTESAVSANRFTFYPGAETWANVRLAGITYDNLKEGEAITAHRKNANTFEPFRNFAITQNGKVAAGEWIDVIRFRDWLAEQIKINVMSVLVNLKNNKGKVPYTDGGIAIITTAMRQALDLGVTRGGIAPEEVDAEMRIIPSYVITAPRAANVSSNDKANRVLNDIGFTARLAGAIHAVTIKGNLTYAM